MTNQQKIQLADIIIREMERSFTGDDMPVMVGVLNKPIGLNGFKMAEIGHPVFEFMDKYVIYLESSTPDKVVKVGEPLVYQDFKVTVPYYKQTLEPFIDKKL
jgi:hypothetical protein